MWITTSKHADAKIKAKAKSIAEALPDFKFVPRGEKPLARMDRLAQREGETLYLVLGKSNIDGKPMLLSRHYIDDGDTCLWMWAQKRMEGLEFMGGKLDAQDEPYEFVVGKNPEDTRFAEFLGYDDGRVEEVYEESVKVGIVAGAKGGEIKIANKIAAEFKFEWKKIDGSEDGSDA